jgi:hypothetical protein
MKAKLVLELRLSQNWSPERRQAPQAKLQLRNGMRAVRSAVDSSRYYQASERGALADHVVRQRFTVFLPDFYPPEGCLISVRSEVQLLDGPYSTSHCPACSYHCEQGFLFQMSATDDRHARMRALDDAILKSPSTTNFFNRRLTVALKPTVR